MAWQITIDEKSMRLDDLTPDDFAKCAEAHDVNWLRLYTSPATDPIAFYDLLCLCADRLGVDAPNRPATIKESVALLEYIEQVDDDLPKMFGEGGIPFQSPEDPETTTSSTSTEPDSGTPTEPDEQA